jgi:hypothetical protein
MCNEELPRQERAAESYVKQSATLDSKVMTAWTKWDESCKKLQLTCDETLSDCPELCDFVDKIKMNSELRYLKARDELRYKLLMIENEEINAFTEYMSDMPSMLKKLYLTLKGYDKAPPALTAEYLEIMKKAKAAKGISWSDKDSESDAHFKFVSNLELNKPSVTVDFVVKKEDLNSTIDIVTDSDCQSDMTDVENREPLKICTNKRKGTPIKLLNNETIIINDSLESLDATRNLDSAKKVKREFNIASEVENFGAFDFKDMNSTFVLAGKVEMMKKPTVKIETKETLKRGLTDRTNMIQRTLNFNDRGERLE